MSSDADYAAFLEKANQDTSGGDAMAQSSSSNKYTTKNVDTKVPEGLMEVQEYYVSDADEEFVPVALGFEGDEITAGDLKKLISTSADIETLSEKDFDPRGTYTSVVDAVKKVGNGSVTVFKVLHTETRSEYYVVSIDKEGKKLVGMKALAVET